MWKIVWCKVILMTCAQKKKARRITIIDKLLRWNNHEFMCKWKVVHEGYIRNA
jgi:hypothetical protein